MAKVQDLEGEELVAVHIGGSCAKGRRDQMEDFYTIIKDFNLAQRVSGGVKAINDDVQRSYVAVFDGHSGKAASRTAAERLHQYLALHPKLRDKSGAETAGQAPPDEERDIADALRAAFVSTDEDILGKTNAGSTALVALRMGHSLYVAHAGDSRAVMSSKGRAEQMTEDHKPTVPRERERIESKGGIIDYMSNRVVSPISRLAMSRALGDPSHKIGELIVERKPDVAVLDLIPQDEFVVLASDGLYDVLNNQEVVDIGRAVFSKAGWKLSEALVEEAADMLVASALAKGTMDNVTAVVMTFEWTHMQGRT